MRPPRRSKKGAARRIQSGYTRKTPPYPPKSKTKDPPVNGPGVFCFYLNLCKAKMDFSAK